MIYLKNILISLMVLILVYACTERIDIKLDDSYTRLVVDGAITTDTVPQRVTLSKSTDYFYNQTSPMVTDATVSISDGELTFYLNEYSPGVYQTGPFVYGVPGKTYTLNIRLATPVGGYSEYTASSTIHPVTAPDSIGLLFHPDWSTSGLWEVRVYLQEPPTVDYYRFLISRNDKMLSDSLNDWFVTDDKFFNGNYTNGATIAYLQQDSPDGGLVPGDKITVEMNSIGKEYFNFLLDAQDELRGSNPLFSGPPANVKGNINNGAVGFFAAYSATRSSAITPRFK